MLGLQRGTVELVKHRPEWAEAAREEIARLTDALAEAGCSIEHVGGTSVPGIPAKPILDLVVGVPAGRDESTVVTVLRGLSYEESAQAAADGRHVLVRGPDPDVRTHHVHVVPLGGSRWTSFLRLRDFLRTHRRARETYAAAKTALARRHSHDRAAYTRAKGELVRPLIDAARAG